MSLVLGSWGHLFSKCVFLAFLGFVGNFSSLPGCQWRCECLERQILTEFFGKAGFSSLWLLVFSWSPTSFASLVEFRGYPGSFHALPSLDLPCNPWLSAPQVPFRAGFSHILPSRDSWCWKHPWLPVPSRILQGGRREKAIFGHLFPELGEQGLWTLCSCFYYLRLCLPAWSSLFPKFGRPRERHSPDPGSTLLFPPTLGVLVPVQCWHPAFFGIKALLARAGPLFICCHCSRSCLPGIWDHIPLGQELPMAALGFLKNRRDPRNVASIGKGAVSFLGDPSP